MPAVEVEDLTIAYGTRRAVDRLSFTADAGEVLVLLGPNGAGKTSTVETLEGYLRPTQGSVRVLGFDPIADHDLLTPHIGVMLQSGSTYPGIRPLEAIKLHAAFYADPADPTELLEQVGLSHVRRSGWRQLSGGEQQRLSLALALVGQPKVAFLDEPAAGVDVQGRLLIRSIVRSLAEAGTCVLITTHDLGEAEKVADRVLILDQGRRIISGTPAELMAAGGSQEIRFGAAPGLDVATLGKELIAAVEEMSPGEYRIDAEPSPTNIATLTNWLAARDLQLGDLRAGRQRLEDVFLRMTAITGEVPAVQIDPEHPRHGRAPRPPRSTHRRDRSQGSRR